MTSKNTPTVADGWIPTRHPGSYYRGCRCEICRDAERIRQKRYPRRYSSREAWRAERIEVDGVLVHPRANHGTVTGYSDYGCHCGPCTEAKRSYDTARKKKIAEYKSQQSPCP